MNVDYAGGTYRMKILLATSDQNNYKMGLAKAPDRFIPAGANYDLAVTHYFAQAEMPFSGYKPSEGKAGLVFAANTDYTSLFVFEWNWEGLCAINRYTGFSWPVSGYQGFGGSMVTTPIRNWAPCTNLVGNNYSQYNRLLVEVRDNVARIFVYNNNTKTQIHVFTDDALRSHRRVGLITGSWECTPVESRFDDFLISLAELDFTLPNTVYLPLISREWPLLDDLIINVGFESGPPAAPWIQISNAGEMIDPLGTRSGNWGVYMGGVELAIDQITQLVEIPVSVPQAQLTYWYLIRTSDSISTIFDEMVCGIWDQNGSLLSLCGRFSNVDQAQGWASHTFDLLAYRGRSVYIGLRAINDEALPTQFFVDDVSLSTGIMVNGARPTCNSWAGLEDIGPLGNLGALENQELDRYPAEFRYRK
jgi:hypothetical protein